MCQLTCSPLLIVASWVALLMYALISVQGKCNLQFAAAMAMCVFVCIAMYISLSDRVYEYPNHCHWVTTDRVLRLVSVPGDYMNCMPVARGSRASGEERKKSLAPSNSSCKSTVARATSRTTSNSRIAPGCVLQSCCCPLPKTGSSCRVSFTAYFSFLVHSFILLFFPLFLSRSLYLLSVCVLQPLNWILCD